MDGLTAVHAGYLVAFQDGEHRLLRGGYLAYADDTIVYVGPDIPTGVTHKVDMDGHLIIPGFISSHGHLVASPFDRGVREDTGNPLMSMSGLYELATVLARPVGEELAVAAAQASILELVHSGVTTAVDMTSWAEEAAMAAERIGFRAFIGPVFQSQEWTTDGRRITYRTLSAAEQRRRFDSAVKFLAARKAGGLVQAFVAPRHVDTVDAGLLREAKELARQFNTFVQIHAAQSAVEFREVLSRTGLTPVQLLANEGVLDDHMVLAHCVFIGGHSWVAHPDVGELRILAESGCVVAHCPWAFARNGQALESLSRYRRAGVTIALGVDTAPQSMLAEMKVGAVIGKLIERDPRTSTARELFDAATIGGARALGRDDIGRLEPGCKADFCAFSLDSSSMSPLHDPLKALVYSATPRDLDSVVIGGRTLMVDGHLLDVDEEGILGDVRRGAREVWDRFSEHDHHGRALDDVCPPSLTEWEGHGH